MSGVHTTKETKEALSAVFGFVKEAGKLSRDGVQVTDGLSLFSNKDLLAKAMLAYQGKELIPAEMKELDQTEIKDLFAYVVVELGEVFDAFGLGVLKNYLLALPEMAELAEINYTRGKAIWERLQNARAPRLDVE